MTFAEQMLADQQLREAREAAAELWAADFDEILRGLKSPLVSVEATNEMFTRLSEKSGLNSSEIRNGVENYAHSRQVKLPGD